MTPSPAAAKPDLRWLTRSLEGLALCGFVVLFYLVPAGATTWVLTLNLVTFYTLLLRSIAKPDRVCPGLPSFVTTEVLFLGFSYLIFYHQYQLALFGAADLRTSVYVTNTFADGSNRAITLATVGMLAFTLGYRIVAPASVAPQSAETPDGNRFFHGLATASGAALLVLASTYVLAGWRSAGEGRYTGTTSAGTGVEGVSIAIVMFCMMVAALWVYAKSARLRTPPMLIVGLVVAFGWTVRLLILGDRGAFLLFALVLAGGYVTFVRKASRVVLAAALGIWMFVYRSMEVLRLTPDWYHSADIWALINDSAYARQTAGESSFNVTTIGLRATVQVFPQLQEYSYGVLKLMQFTTIIPFSGGFYLPYLNPDYTSTAIMLGDIMLPASADYEPGTNVISDAYIDFGVAGVVVLLFAVGWLAKVIRNSVSRNPGDPHRVVMYLLTMAMLAELPRYAIEVPARTLAWAFVFSICVGAVTGRFDRRDDAHSVKITAPSVAGYSRSRS